MPYPNQHAARQRDPGKYSKMRTGKLPGSPKGVTVIFGVLPSGKTEIQSIRFDRRTWTVARARQWLKSHNFRSTIEPATGKSKVTKAAELQFWGGVL